MPITFPRSHDILTSPCRSDSDDDQGDDDLLTFKNTCLQLSEAALLNRELVRYRQDYTKSLIETVKDNLNSAVLLMGKIRKATTSKKPLR